jgi:hypothetical protein
MRVIEATYLYMILLHMCVRERIRTKILSVTLRLCERERRDPARVGRTAWEARSSSFFLFFFEKTLLFSVPWLKSSPNSAVTYYHLSTAQYRTFIRSSISSLDPYFSPLFSISTSDEHLAPSPLSLLAIRF